MCWFVCFFVRRWYLPKTLTLRVEKFCFFIGLFFLEAKKVQVKRPCYKARQSMPPTNGPKIMTIQVFTKSAPNRHLLPEVTTAFCLHFSTPGMSSKLRRNVGIFLLYRLWHAQKSSKALNFTLATLGDWGWATIMFNRFQQLVSGCVEKSYLLGPCQFYCLKGGNR